MGVPEEVMALVRALPEWADAGDAGDLRVEALPGGITNRNYRVDTGGPAYVVRIPGERTELLGIDRAGELEAAQRAASLGIGPPVLGVLPGVGTVITELVPGAALADGAALAAGDRLEQLVDHVAALHRSPPLAASFPVFRVIERHAVDAVAHGVELPAEHDELAVLMTQIEATFAIVDAAPAPCHNDLLPANVLVSADRVWLIDYEYAGMNEAMFDLANLSVNAGFDAATDDRLLARYSGLPPGDFDRARLALMKIVSEMREGMWALVQRGISDLAEVDFDRYAAERLASCRAHAESLDLATVIAAAVAGPVS